MTAPSLDGLEEAVHTLAQTPKVKNAPSAISRRLGLRRILVATDGSPPGTWAVGWAQRIARVYGADVEVVTSVTPQRIVDRYGIVHQALIERENETARTVLSDATAFLTRKGITPTSKVLEGRPGPAITDRADAVRADLVVVGSHGRGGVGRILMGSVSDAIKNDAVNRNVLVAKQAPRKGAILAPIDGSPMSVRAAALALHLGQAWNAPVRVIYVLSSTVLALPENVQDAYEEAAEGLSLPSWSGKDVTFERTYGPAAQTICEEAAKDRARLVVMGARGMGNLKRRVLGSVSNAVVHRARCSVLLVR